VVDLAKGHIAALEKLKTGCGYFVCNLGTGRGYSVLDVLHAYEKACGRELPYEITARRSGDIAECYADPTKAREELGWEAKLGIDEMCASSWKWQSMNPNGYRSN
jgi:UDP-glucose 4-epimerase